MRLRTLGLLIVIGGSVLVWAGTASADYTWNGAFYCGGQYGCSYGDGWSEGNWTTGPPAAGDPALGTLNFPALPNCGQGACYQSLNDLTFPMSATGIDIDDDVGYEIQGDDGSGTTPPIALGSGGITATPVAAANGRSGVYWAQPLALTVPQTWSLTGDGTPYDTSFSLGSVTAAGSNPGADTLAITLADAQTLTLSAGLDVGAVTVTGADPSYTGATAGQNGTVFATDINGNDAAPVTIDNVLYGVEPNETHLAHTETSGPLTTNGAYLQIGDGNVPDGILSVNGAVTIGSGTVTALEIDQNGSTPGTDFGQLSATGNVTLGGSLNADGGGCVVGVGDTATLITTTGTLSGTFTDAANGAMTPLLPCFGADPLGAQIAYGSHSMTATVVPGASTATLLTESPSSPAADQAVTLTAAVSAATDLHYGPAGTVEFLNGTTPIAGCAAQTVTASSGNAATATCQTAFGAPNPADLSAVFTPASGSTLTGSSSTRVGSTGGQGTTAAGGSPGTGSSQGGSSTPTATAVPTSTSPKASTAKLAAAKLSGSSVGVSLSCSGAKACKVSVALTITEKLRSGHVTAVGARASRPGRATTITKTLTLSRATVTIAGNGRRAVKLSLNAAGRRLLTERQALAVKLIVTADQHTVTSTILHFKLTRKHN